MCIPKLAKFFADKKMSRNFSKVFGSDVSTNSAFSRILEDAIARGVTTSCKTNVDFIEAHLLEQDNRSLKEAIKVVRAAVSPQVSFYFSNDLYKPKGFCELQELIFGK